MAKKKQKTIIQKLDSWHKTKHGFLLFGVFELLIAYGFISWAIDNGQLWTYLIGFIFLGGGIRNIFRMFRRLLKK